MGEKGRTRDKPESAYSNGKRHCKNSGEFLAPANARSISAWVTRSSQGSHICSSISLNDVLNMFSLRSGIVDDRSVFDETVFAAKDAAACIAHRVLRRHVDHERRSGMVFRLIEDKSQMPFAPK